VDRQLGTIGDNTSKASKNDLMIVDEKVPDKAGF
jgi:hypothetical protein